MYKLDSDTYIHVATCILQSYILVFQCTSQHQELHKKVRAHEDVGMRNTLCNNITQWLCAVFLYVKTYITVTHCWDAYIYMYEVCNHVV